MVSRKTGMLNRKIMSFILSMVIAIGGLGNVQLLIAEETSVPVSVTIPACDPVGENVFSGVNNVTAPALLLSNGETEDTTVNTAYAVSGVAVQAGGETAAETSDLVTASAVTVDTGEEVSVNTENNTANNNTGSDEPQVKADKEITGEIIPSVIEEEKDISSLSMNKIMFSLKETDNLATSSAEVSMERVYTVGVTGKGGLYLAIAQADTMDFTSLKMQVYSDSSLTKKIGKNYIIKPNTKIIDTQSYYLNNAGTYYLKFTYKGSAKDKNFAMSAAFMYSTDRTLTEGKSLVTYADAKQRTVYYKIKVKKEGLVSYTAIPEDGTSLLTGRIALCDKNKKAVSVEEYVSGSEDNNKAVHAYYMVKPGTYYIRVKLDGAYIGCFTTEKVKDTAGTDRSKAGKVVFGGKEKKGALYLSDSVETEKWYRFRLKKNRNFSIIVNSCVNGYLNVEVCNAAGVTVKSGTTNFYTGTKILKTSSKWQKGTYYIKVTKVKKSKKSSGYFSIRLGK